PHPAWGVDNHREETIHKPYGNLTGLKPSQIAALERLYRRKVPATQVVTPELAQTLCVLSLDLGRQVGILLDRRGVVDKVIVGDATSLQLPDLGRARAGSLRFRGVRLIHTHLREEELTRDDLTDLSKLRLDLIAALLVSTDNRPLRIHA